MFFKAQWVKKQDPGNEKMVSISSAIKKGALAFLNAEYRLCLLYTSPSPRDLSTSRMPSSA